MKAIKLPAWPRLQGGIGFKWQLELSDKEVRIVPAAIPFGLIIFWLALGGLQFLIINIYLILSSKYLQYWAISAWSVLALLFLGLISGIFYFYARLQINGGPVLIADLDNGVIRLPRGDCEYKMSAVRSVDIVFGRHVANPIPNATPSWVLNPSIQLQLRVEEDGYEVAWPLLKDSGSRNRQFENAAQLLADRLGVSVMFVDEDSLSPSV